MKHLLSPLDFSVEELDNLMDIAKDIEANPKKYAHACEGKKLATLFYEPSTRTRLSHEAAMINLGGSVLGFSSADSSSASKGESVADTIRVISCFADICAMRHPKEGAAMVASQHATIPVINAGDGGHQHPTQTLTDMLTIRSLKGRLDNMTIGLCGDLKFGRTVHSLIHALVRYPGIRFVLISPEELKLPSYIKNDVLDRQNIPYEEEMCIRDSFYTFLQVIIYDQVVIPIHLQCFFFCTLHAEFNHVHCLRTTAYQTVLKFLCTRRCHEQKQCVRELFFHFQCTLDFYLKDYIFPGI